MKSREYIYTVTGEVRINAKTPDKAKQAIHSLLLGLEWTMNNPEARLKRNSHPGHLDDNDEDFDI